MICPEDLLPPRSNPPMTQYERIAHFEVVLKLRDQRRQRFVGIAKAVFAVTLMATAALLLNT